MYTEELFENFVAMVVQDVLVFGSCVILFSFFAGLILHYHIAGPIFVIKQYLNDLIEGKTPRHPIKLRKHDFLVDVTDKLNIVSEKFSLYKLTADKLTEATSTEATVVADQASEKTNKQE